MVRFCLWTFFVASFMVFLLGNTSALEPEWEYDAGDFVVDLSLSEDGSILASGMSTASIHDTDSSTPAFTTADTGVQSVAVTGDGRFMATGSTDDRIRFFGNSSSTPLWTYNTGSDIKSVSASWDGGTIAVANDGGKLMVFNSTGDQPEWTFSTGSAINSVAVSQDGEYIVAGRSNGQVYLFSRDSNIPVWNYGTGSSVTTVAISGDGSYMTVGSGNKRVYLFEKDDSTPLWYYLTGDSVDSVDISLAGNYLVAGGGDSKVYLFGRESSQPVWDYETTGWVLDVAISGNGEYIAAGGLDSTIYCFSRNSAVPKWSHTASSAIQAVSISHYGGFVASGGYDSKVSLFHNPLRPRAFISEAPAEMVIRGSSANFSGYAEDAANIISYLWASSLDGNLSSEAQFTTSALSAGEHIIVFNASYADGNRSEPASAQVLVNARPVSQVMDVSPTNSFFGHTVWFNGSASDDDGLVSGVEWLSSLDGLLSTSLSFTTTSLSEGTHDIVFRARDNYGTWSFNSTKRISVYRTEVPIAQITTLPAVAIEGEIVQFSGNGTDVDGFIVIYEWYSSIDGFLSAQPEFQSDALTPAHHTISFRVRDNSTAWSEWEEAQLVIHGIPSVTGASLEDPQVVRPGEGRLLVNGNDPDGFDPMVNLIVESSREGSGWVEFYNQTVYYDGQPWLVPISVAASEAPGNVSLRTRLLDLNGTYGGWVGVDQPLVVLDRKPVIEQAGLERSSIRRGENVTLYLTASDELTPPALLTVEYQHRLDGGNWSSGFEVESSLIDGRWYLNLTPPGSAALGEYQFRVSVIDAEGERSAWYTLPDLSVQNRVPGISSVTTAHVTQVGFDYDNLTFSRGFTLQFSVSPSDFEDTSEQLLVELFYKSPQDLVWQTASIGNYTWNQTLQSYLVEFQPDGDAFTGSYSFMVRATDQDGKLSQELVLGNYLQVINSRPVAYIESRPGGPVNPQELDELFFSGMGVDHDGSIASYHWQSDISGTLAASPSFSISTMDLKPGLHTISFKVRDNNDEWSNVEVFSLEVMSIPGEEEITFFGYRVTNIMLFGASTGGLAISLGALYLISRRKQAETGPSQEESVTEEEQIERKTVVWKTPDARKFVGHKDVDAERFTDIIEMLKYRRKSYLAHPDNEKELDYLHNNRERFTISSYFEVPTSPDEVIAEWGLPENIRGNVHLDRSRREIVETVLNSYPAKNFVIIGDPGIGKTVLLFDILDRLMDREPTGIITTPSLGNMHWLLGLRVFYDDIPENPEIVQAIVNRKIDGMIVSAREADWNALPSDFRDKFDRLSVPGFSEQDMENLCRRMLEFSSLGYDEEVIPELRKRSEGSPIYVWSLIRELLHRGERHLDMDYIRSNSVQGMTNYVTMLLQRLLKEGEDYKPGGRHALACLVCLANHFQEKRAYDLFFDQFTSELSGIASNAIGEEMYAENLNRTLDYLSGEGHLIRFPHDTWVDVLQGRGRLNPFRSELRRIQRELSDTGLFREAMLGSVASVWSNTLARYEENTVNHRDSILALADTLVRNFTWEELKQCGVDLELLNEIARLYSHIPIAARLLSKLELQQPQHEARIINIQDSIVRRSDLGRKDSSQPPYKITDLFLIYHDGRLIASNHVDKARVDSEIMGSMLTAINDFVKDSLRAESDLGSLDYGDNSIALERGENIVLAAVVYGEVTLQLKSRLSKTIRGIEKHFSDIFPAWNGDIGLVSEAAGFLEELIDSTSDVDLKAIEIFLSTQQLDLQSGWEINEDYLEITLNLINYSSQRLTQTSLGLDYDTSQLELESTVPEFEIEGNNVLVGVVDAHDEIVISIRMRALARGPASVAAVVDYKRSGIKGVPLNVKLVEDARFVIKGTDMPEGNNDDDDGLSDLWEKLAELDDQ